MALGGRSERERKKRKNERLAVDTKAAQRRRYTHPRQENLKNAVEYCPESGKRETGDGHGRAKGRKKPNVITYKQPQNVQSGMYHCLNARINDFFGSLARPADGARAARAKLLHSLDAINVPINKC